MSSSAAFRRHWPDRFAELLGSVGESLLTGCTADALDRNRHLKLRRIAAENLSQIL
jgi:hypothetical protein